MGIKENVAAAINEQINHELSASYLYLSMSAYFETANLKGFASWMRNQSEEEHEHALKLYHYLIQRRGKVELMAVEKPKMNWKSPLEAFEDAFKHEVKVTGLIGDLVKLSDSEGDFTTFNFLQWFISEQVEEEDTANEIMEKVKMASDEKSALFMIDRELGMRGQAK